VPLKSKNNNNNNYSESEDEDLKRALEESLRHVSGPTAPGSSSEPIVISDDDNGYEDDEDTMDEELQQALALSKALVSSFPMASK